MRGRDYASASNREFHHPLFFLSFFFFNAFSNLVTLQSILEAIVIPNKMVKKKGKKKYDAKERKKDMNRNGERRQMKRLNRSRSVLLPPLPSRQP